MKKSVFLKLLSAVLAVMMLLPVLAACKDKPEEETQTETGDAPVVPDPKEDMSIIADGKTEFKVVRPEKNVTDFDKMAISELTKYFSTEYNVNVKTGDDWVNDKLGYTESKYEILIGRTNREASELIYDNLRTDDFAVTIVGTKIVIAAYTEEKMTQALNYFKEKVKVSANEATLKAADAKIEKAQYEVDSIKINGNELSNYNIVLNSTELVSIRTAAEKLKKILSEKYRYELNLVIDSVEESPYEIVIGSTNRKETEAIQVSDYIISVGGNKIYMNIGSGKETADNAISALLEKLSEITNDKKIEITEESLKINFKGVYNTSDFLLNGKKITEYKIIYSKDNTFSRIYALQLRDEIEKFCGYRIAMDSDTAKASENEIIIGYSDRIEKSDELKSIIPLINGLKDDEFIACKAGSSIYLGAKDGDFANMGSAAKNLINTIRKTASGETVSLAYGDNNAHKAQVSEYKFMSYNDGDESYAGKLTERVAIMTAYDADIIGLQEVSKQQVPLYRGKMKDYEVLFHEAQNEGGWIYGNAILYKKDKFELLEQGRQWLSDTPDKAYSAYETSAYTRSYGFAKLKDKQTGEVIVAVNCHVDYNVAANTLQVKKLLELTNERFEGYPIFYTGDFNMWRNQDGYKEMLASGLFDSERYLDGKATVERIDFVFTSPNGFIPKKFEYIDNHKFSGSASDHKAIMTTVQMPY